MSISQRIRPVFKVRLFMMFGLLLLICPLFAQEDVSFMDMSLEELLDFQVLPASIFKRPIEKSPAVVDVITQEQIKDFDAENLYELIGYLPGVETMETYFGRTVAQFRGVMNVHYNNKFLFMVNGNPVFEPVNGTSFLELIPLNAIEKIEVIRGRGATLYGTNAYSGVVNIMTKQQVVNNKKLAVKAGYGSFSTTKAAIEAGRSLKKNASVYVAADMSKGDGYPFDVEADEKGVSETFDYQNDLVRVYANLQYKNFSLEAGYMHQEKMLYGLVPILAYKGLGTYNMVYTNARYVHQLTQGVKSVTSLRFNKYDVPSLNIGYFPFAGFGGHDTSTVYSTFGGYRLNAEQSFDMNISSKVYNISGIVYESAKSDPYKFVWKTDKAIHPYSAYPNTEPDSYTISGFSQFHYMPSKAFEAVAGARVVKNSDIDDVLMFNRLGVMYNLEGKYYIKLLYGEAFRIPDFFEKYVATYNVLFGSTDLEPEQSKSFDLSLEGNLDHFKTRLNGFVTMSKNGICRTPTSTPELHGEKAAVYVNLAEATIKGIEYSVQSLAVSKCNYGFNFSWKTGKDDETDKDLVGFANVTSNLWMNYKIVKGISLTPYLQYVGERKAGTVDDSTVDPYLLLNLSLCYEKSDYTVYLTMSNLTDVNYEYPEYVRHNIPAIPGGPGRSVRASVQFVL